MFRNKDFDVKLILPWKLTPPLLAQHLLARCIMPRIFEPIPLVIRIRRMTDFLLKGKVDNQSLRNRSYTYQLALCTAVAHAPGSLREIDVSEHSLGESETESQKSTLSDGNQILAAAAAVGDEGIVHSLLLTTPTLESASVEFELPLPNAAMCGHVSIVCLLLKYFKKVWDTQEKVCVETLSRALIAASAHGRTEVVETLLEFSVERSPFEQVDIVKALEGSVKGDHRQAVDIMLEKCDPVGRNAVLAKLLLLACRSGSSSVSKMLLDHGADTTQKPCNGQTCLQEASRSGSLLTVRTLLSRGVKYKDGNHGSLVLAAKYGHEDVVRHFLSLGVNVNESTEWFSSLSGPAARGELSMVRFLSRDGVGLYRPGIGGLALEHAAAAGEADIVRFFVELGLSPNGTEEGEKPMVLALTFGRQDVVRVLLELGAEEVEPSDTEEE